MTAKTAEDMARRARCAVSIAERFRALNDCRMARFWLRQHIILRSGARALAKQAKERTS